MEPEHVALGIMVAVATFLAVAKSLIQDTKYEYFIRDYYQLMCLWTVCIMVLLSIVSPESTLIALVVSIVPSWLYVKQFLRDKEALEMSNGHENYFNIFLIGLDKIDEIDDKDLISSITSHMRHCNSREAIAEFKIKYKLFLSLRENLDLKYRIDNIHPENFNS